MQVGGSRRAVRVEETNSHPNRTHKVHRTTGTENKNINIQIKCFPRHIYIYDGNWRRTTVSDAPQPESIGAAGHAGGR